MCRVIFSSSKVCRVKKRVLFLKPKCFFFPRIVREPFKDQKAISSPSAGDFKNDKTSLQARLFTDRSPVWSFITFSWLTERIFDYHVSLGEGIKLAKGWSVKIAKSRRAETRQRIAWHIDWKTTCKKINSYTESKIHHSVAPCCAIQVKSSQVKNE